jgi:hypothetical protein
MRHIKEFGSGLHENSRVNEAWPDDLYNGEIKFTLKYKDLGLDLLTEKFHKESGIPREYILNELLYFIEMDVESDVIAEIIGDFQKDRLDLIKENWASLDKEEQEEMIVIDKLRKRII